MSFQQFTFEDEDSTDQLPVKQKNSIKEQPKTNIEKIPQNENIY